MVPTALLLATVTAGGAQPSAPSPPPPEVFSSSSCRAQFQSNLARINAQHIAEAKGCRGTSACITAANDQKARALQEEGRTLYICQKTERDPTQPPLPSRAPPPPVPDFVTPDVPPPAPRGGSPDKPAQPGPPTAPDTATPTRPPTSPPRTPDLPPQAEPVRPTELGTWSLQGPDWVYTDPTGKPWIFKPTFTFKPSAESSERVYELDRRSVFVGHHPTKGDVVAATYVWKDRLTGGDRVTVDGQRPPGY